MYKLKKQRKLYLILWGISALWATADIQAQSAQDSIRQVIQQLFVAMKAADTAALRNCFTETAMLQTFTRTKEGAMQISTQSVSDFCKAVGGMAPGMADERISFAQLHVDAHLASVWTPFKLYINGSFYSCGVNSIQMARLNGIWKIQYLLDTRRKDQCIE